MGNCLIPELERRVKLHTKESLKEKAYARELIKYKDEENNTFKILILGNYKRNI